MNRKIGRVAVVAGAMVLFPGTARVRLVPLEPIAANSPATFVVDVNALRPIVLHDEVADAEYLAAFPTAAYRLRPSTGLGNFYIDTTDDMIKANLDAGHGWERDIRAVMEMYIARGTSVLDIGAHIGAHTLAMGRAVGPHGHVFAFEPQKKLFRELSMNLNVNQVRNVTALRFAVGDGEPRVVEMNVVTEGNEGGTGIGGGGERAELRTVDSFGFRNVSLIKIDVEGYENYVLDGAARTIAAQRPVLVVEILGGTDYDTATPEARAEIDVTKAKMKGLGYHVTRVSVHDYLGVPIMGDQDRSAAGSRESTARPARTATAARDR